MLEGGPLQVSAKSNLQGPSIDPLDGNHWKELLAQGKLREVVDSIQSALGMYSINPFDGNHSKQLLAQGKLRKVVDYIQSAQICVLSTPLMVTI